MLEGITENYIIYIYEIGEISEFQPIKKQDSKQWSAMRVNMVFEFVNYCCVQRHTVVIYIENRLKSKIEVRKHIGFAKINCLMAQSDQRDWKC
jgi:hypothetical protein